MVENNEVYLWLAREKYHENLIYLYDSEPVFMEYEGKDKETLSGWYNPKGFFNDIYLGGADILPEITFEKSPVKVKLVIIE